MLSYLHDNQCFMSFYSPRGFGPETLQQSSGLLVHWSYHLYPVSTFLFSTNNIAPYMTAHKKSLQTGELRGFKSSVDILPIVNLYLRVYFQIRVRNTCILYNLWYVKARGYTVNTPALLQESFLHRFGMCNGTITVSMSLSDCFYGAKIHLICKSRVRADLQQFVYPTHVTKNKTLHHSC